jgi:hypothetical protein
MSSDISAYRAYTASCTQSSVLRFLQTYFLGSFAALLAFAAVVFVNKTGVIETSDHCICYVESVLHLLLSDDKVLYLAR